MRTPPNERLTSDIAEAAATRDSGSAGSCPQRKCIITGETGARDAMLRLAVSPDGEVLPDPLAKAPGRGAWIGAGREQIEDAVAKGQLKGALARAFKGASLMIPADLPQLIEQALDRVLRDRIGIEMRAGHIVLGSERIAEQARQGRIALLLHASDASEDGRKKLDQAWRVGQDAQGSGNRGLTLPLDRAALSVALGRDNVVHLGVSGHGRAADAAARRVEAAVLRLLHYSKAPGPDSFSAGAQSAPASDNELNA